MSFAPDSGLVNEIHASPNVEPRRNDMQPTILLLHYTGLVNCAKAVDWLARPESKVSCHYVIDQDGRIIQMVPEEMRAWHAGLSSWAGETDINSASIGIEIHNPGHDLGYPEFPDAQMGAVIALSRDIIVRHGIRPERVLAHSDVAPVRKMDPGEKFDWAGLARSGVGHWIEPAPVDPCDCGVGKGDRDDLICRAQEMLRRYGYDIEPTAQFDEKTEFVVRAFQRHFRPSRVDGRIDQSTLITLERLIASLPGAAVA